jgi:hypothetical protein
MAVRSCCFIGGFIACDDHPADIKRVDPAATALPLSGPVSTVDRMSTIRVLDSTEKVPNPPVVFTQVDTRGAESLALRMDTEAVKFLGRPKRHDSPNTSLLSAIARIAMREPNSVIKERLFELHQKIRTALIDFSDEALDWLIADFVNSWGGFSSVAQLRGFLNKDPKYLNTSRLIIGLQCLLTMMGYRECQSDQVSTLEQEKMANFLMLLLRDFTVERVTTVYPQRREDLLDQSCSALPEYDPSQECLGLQRAELSEASDSESESKVCNPSLFIRVPHKKFRLFSPLRSSTSEDESPTQRVFSWVGEAFRRKIPIRSHVSGTITLVASVIDAFLHNSAWFADDQNVDQFIGAICLSTFERGDFHSIPETMAGLQYYLSERAKKMKKATIVPTILPKDAYAKGIHLMISTINPKYQAPCNHVAASILAEVSTDY